MPSQNPSAPRRNAFLDFMHHFYAYYLGVTPPSPENEKKIAAVVLGGVVLLVIFLVVFVRVLLSTLFSR
jgi:hypothetical protein